MTTDLQTDALLGLKKLEEAYDSEPWWYDVRGFFILTFAYRSTLWAQLELFGRNMKAGGRHLEAAIGTATLFDLVLRWRRLHRLPAVRTVGFDYAAPMLAGARQRLGRDAQVSLLQADVARLDFPDASFDSANIANAVHCFPDVDAGLAELHRVLKPGATLALNALVTPRGFAPLRWLAERINAWGMKKGILHAVYEEGDVLHRLLRAGFALASVELSGNTLNVVARRA